MTYTPKDPQFCSGGLPCQNYPCAFFDCCEFSDYWTEEELEIFQRKSTSHDRVETADFPQTDSKRWLPKFQSKPQTEIGGGMEPSAVCGVEEVSKCPRQN